MFSENQLIDACLNNNREVQKIFYMRYAPFLKGVCMRYEKDSDNVSDLLQETFIKVFQNLSKFTRQGSFEGWLRRIAVNNCLDHLNKKKFAFSTNDSYEYSHVLYEEIEDQCIINQMLDLGFSKQMLIDVLHHLPVNYATVFNLYFIDEWSHLEISTYLNITESLSRKWLYRAKDLVKKQLLIILDNTPKYQNSYAAVS